MTTREAIVRRILTATADQVFWQRLIEERNATWIVKLTWIKQLRRARRRETRARAELGPEDSLQAAPAPHRPGSGSA